MKARLVATQLCARLPLSRFLPTSTSNPTGPLAAILASTIFAMTNGIAAEATEHRHYNLDNRPVNLAEWHPRYRELCTFPGRPKADAGDVKPIDELLARLHQESELGEHLMHAPLALGTAICLDESVEVSCGYFDYHFNIIGIGKSLAPVHQLIVLVHELRHAGHVAKGYRVSLEYDIREMVRLTYAIEADAQAFTALYAWRSRQRGVPEIWYALLDWELYADIATAFGRQMEASGDESAAARAAFEQWYRSPWRLMNYRQNCRTGYLDLQDETKRIPQHTLLPADFFENLCVLPNGQNYGCPLSSEIAEPPKEPFDQSPP